MGSTEGAVLAKTTDSARVGVVVTGLVLDSAAKAFTVPDTWVANSAVSAFCPAQLANITDVKKNIVAADLVFIEKGRNLIGFARDIERNPKQPPFSTGSWEERCTMHSSPMDVSIEISGIEFRCFAAPG
jgi:hypothetical protein